MEPLDSCLPMTTQIIIRLERHAPVLGAQEFESARSRVLCTTPQSSEAADDYCPPPLARALSEPIQSPSLGRDS